MKLPATKRETIRGFTLIELMVVVVIATILVTLALPSFMQQIRQSRRTEAKTALLDLAGREERYLSTAAAGAGYSAANADLGYPGAAWPQNVASGYYQVTVCVAAAGQPSCNAQSAVPGPMYFISATPVAGQSQALDTQCTSFGVDSVGQQYATSGTGQTVAFCWGN
jgi:type IV pilus assembly protein PilE